MQPTWEQLTRSRRASLDRQPPPRAWMQPPDAPGTYRDKFHAATATETGADLAGRITLAVPHVGRYGTFHAAALAIDASGEKAIQRTLAAAIRLGYAAFTIACASGQGRHNEEYVYQTIRDRERPGHPRDATPSQGLSTGQQHALGAQGGRR